MASLNGQTIASSYEQLLHTDTDGGGNGNTLVTIKDGDNGTTFGLKLATNKVEVIPSAADDANAFEVSKNDGTAVFTVNSSTPSATLTGTLTATKALSSDTQTTPETILTLGATYANTGTDGGAGSGSRIEFQIPDDETNPITGAAIAGIKEAADDSDASAGMAFYVSQNDTTLDEVVRIDHDGNVGIGTTSPEDLLHIQGGTASVSDTQLVLEGRYGGYGAGINFVSRTSSGGTNVSMAKITADGEAAFDTTAANQDAGLRFFTTLNGSSAEKMRLKSDGKVLIGSTSSRALSGVNAQLQIEGTDYNTSGLHLIGNTGTDASTAPILFFGRSRGTSDGSSTSVASGDRLGALFFCGADGSDISTPAATIQISVDGTPGGNDMPGRIEFRTTADGASSTTERMRIASDGRVAIKATSIPQDFGGERGHLLISSTDNSGANNYGVLQIQGHSIANDAAIGGIYFYDHSNNNAIIQAARSSDTDDARLAFYTSNSGGSPNKQMTIEASGRMFYQAGSNFKTSTIGSVDRLGMIDFYDDAGYNPVLHVMSDRADPDFSPLRLTGGQDNPTSASACIWIDFHDGDGTHRGGIQNGSTADNPEFFNGGSDERIKTNIVNTATNGLQIINGLELKDFTVKEWYNGYSSDVKCDFVAQNAEEHFPNMVSEHKMKPKKEEFRQDFVDAGLEAVEVETALGTEEMFPVKCISHSALIPILVKALQEADNKVDTLTARVEALENA